MPMTLLWVCLALVISEVAVCVVSENKTYVRYDGYRILRLHPTSVRHEETVHHIAKRYGVTLYRSRRSVDAQVAPEHYYRVLRQLNVNDVNFDVIIHDLERLIGEQRQQNLLPQEDFFSSYHTFEEILEWMNEQAEACGMRCHIHNIGRSFEGRPLTILQIGNTRGRPSIWIDAGIHAREWVSPPTALFIAKMLISEYHHDGQVRHLADSFNWYILPVINPDGYDYTWTADRMWRKTRSVHSQSTEECVGTDANRNFDFQWQAVGASGDPCDETYAGPQPFSEPECLAVARFVRALRPALFLTLHSYGQLILTPWGYTRNTSRDIDDMILYGRLAAEALRDVYGTEYTVGSSANVLYPSSGTSRDWARGAAHVPFVYTVELRDTGRYGFLLPPKQIAPTARETWSAVRSLANQISTHIFENT